MTANGTSRYEGLEQVVPPLVMEAVAIARQADFELTVHPATGRLLAALVAGVGDGIVGETGTGTGAGIAWMLSAAAPTTRFVSIELDPGRAAAAAALFDHDERVTILQGDGNDLAAHGPFDLLVIDAPSTPGPLDSAAFDPVVQLRPNGLLVKDDLWPMTSWPPRTPDGEVDERRQRWLEHPHLFATEITVAEGFSVLVARRRP